MSNVHTPPAARLDDALLRAAVAAEKLHTLNTTYRQTAALLEAEVGRHVLQLAEQSAHLGVLWERSVLAHAYETIAEVVAGHHSNKVRMHQAWQSAGLHLSDVLTPMEYTATWDGDVLTVMFEKSLPLHVAQFCASESECHVYYLPAFSTRFVPVGIQGFRMRRGEQSPFEVIAPAVPTPSSPRERKAFEIWRMLGWPDEHNPYRDLSGVALRVPLDTSNVSWAVAMLVYLLESMSPATPPYWGQVAIHLKKHFDDLPTQYSKEDVKAKVAAPLYEMLYRDWLVPAFSGMSKAQTIDAIAEEIWNTYAQAVSALSTWER